MRRSLRCNSHRLRTVATCGCMRWVHAFWKAFAAWRIYKDHVHLRKKTNGSSHIGLQNYGERSNQSDWPNRALVAMAEVCCPSPRYESRKWGAAMKHCIQPRLQPSHIDVYIATGGNACILRYLPFITMRTTTTTSLQYAVWHGKLDTMLMLIGWGANSNER